MERSGGISSRSLYEPFIVAGHFAI